MNKKAMFWMLALALSAAPALVAAQGGPDFDDEEEVEMMGEPGMPPGGPGMGQGMQGGPQWQEKGAGPSRQMMIKKKMAMRGGQGKMGFMNEERILEVIKKHDAAFAKKVSGLREEAPAKYKMVMQMAGKMFAAAKMSGDESVAKDGVRGLSLEFESKELALSYNKASDSEKKEIKAKLKKVLAELFDIKSKGQELRVKHMGQELKRLEDRLQKRKANKDKIVQQRLDQMTGEGFGW